MKRVVQTIRLTMFHFRCPLCGACPTEVLLRDYLDEWARSGLDRVGRLFGLFYGAIRQLRNGQFGWRTKKLLRSVDRLERGLAPIQDELHIELPEQVMTTRRGEMVFLFECPVCQTDAGMREEGPYFKSWSQPERIQYTNLLYETGLILWRLIREVPVWCDARLLQSLDTLRQTLRTASESAGRLECPICGRFGHHLYGTGGQFCRWCLDMGGGFGVRIEVDAVEGVRLMETDPARAQIEDPELLPPRD